VIQQKCSCGSLTMSSRCNQNLASAVDLSNTNLAAKSSTVRSRGRRPAASHLAKAADQTRNAPQSSQTNSQRQPRLYQEESGRFASSWCMCCPEDVDAQLNAAHASLRLGAVSLWSHPERRRTQCDQGDRSAAPEYCLITPVMAPPRFDWNSCWESLLCEPDIDDSDQVRDDLQNSIAVATETGKRPGCSPTMPGIGCTSARTRSPSCPSSPRRPSNVHRQQPFHGDVLRGGLFSICAEESSIQSCIGREREGLSRRAWRTRSASSPFVSERIRRGSLKIQICAESSDMSDQRKSFPSSLKA